MADAQVVPAGGLAKMTVQATRHAILLTHSSRRLLWFLLVSLQLATATLLAFFASVYFMRNTPNSLLWTVAIYFIFADAYEFISRFSFTVAAGYTLLSAAFAFNGLRLVWFSLASRRLSFGTAKRLQDGLHLGFEMDKPTPVAVHQGRLYRRLQRLASACSVHGPWFDGRQITSEIISLASQTTAAYLASRSISNVYLNQTYGLVIFLNGISTLVFHKLLRRGQLMQRVACLLTDLVLDFVWGCVLPLWMLVPTWNMLQGALSANLANSETSAREIRRVFVLSSPSYLLSLVPFVNLLMTAVELRTILRDDVGWVSHPQVPTTATPNHLHPWWVKCAHVLLAVYGCVVFAVSLSAVDVLRRIHVQPQYECKFRLYPWFSTKEACIRRTIDCSAVGIAGQQTELESALGLLDEDSLSDISFTQCSSFEMPTTLSRFTSLETIIIQLSWVASWPIEANLSDENFARLKTVKLLDVDTNSTLHGLVSTPLATSVEYIRFGNVPNAASILAPVGENWQHLIYFDCDRCNLTAVPPAVDAMHQLLTLSFQDSQIADLRDDFITRWNLNLIGIWMDGNAGLSEFSDLVWSQAATADMFAFQRTNISVIPDWLPTIARTGFVVHAYGTPICDPVKLLIASMPTQVRDRVLCTETDNS